MSGTLADLRKAPPPTRPERSVTVCLAPHLVAEIQKLSEELGLLPPEPVSLDSEDETEGRKKRQGEGRNTRAAQIDARLAELFEEMAEAEGELRVRAITDGDWRLWVDEHPPRPEGQPGHQRDEEVTFGVCNADALIEDLGRYAYTWNGDRLAEGDWAEHLQPRLSSPDLKLLATTVVSMHESRLDFREWRSFLSVGLSRSRGSVWPATSTSAPDDSTAGSPEPSNEGSTGTATPAP